eukprot:GEMP01044066.1.p1 GENE.GEMP01044066.1~~GEMP01044066.1.p1  ORF type:complete len:180 (+),score=39.15 GEMP01044066.1:179-718(+)
MLGTCKLCTDPASLFGGNPSRPKRKAKKNDGVLSVASSKEDYNPRTDKQIEALLQQWSGLVSERVHSMFPTKESLRNVLETLGKHIDKTSDPIQGSAEKCSQWYGEYTDDADGREAAITLQGDGNKENVTFVNRVLAFIFASDESFAKLQKLPRKPFRMRCGNQLCINLKHIDLDPSSA